MQEDVTFSRNLACVHCGISFQELAPNSFHSILLTVHRPMRRTWRKEELDINLIIPDWDKTINEEGLAPLADRERFVL